MTTPTEATTLLFVPGDRPDRFDKAVAAGPDLVVLDLEDAVAADAKDDARAHVRDWLAAGGGAAVRINPLGDPAYDADVSALADLAVPVVVPKAEDPAALRDLRARLHADSPLIALVETARGVLRAPEIAEVDGVGRLVLGTYDLAAQLGVSPESREAMAHARQVLVLASAAAGLAGPVDGVTGVVAEPERLADDLAHAVGLGFAGKLCIHPRQVAQARAAFLPSDDEVAWARRVVESDTGGAVLLDGAMIDRPVVERARRLLATAQPDRVRASGDDG